MSRKRPRSKDAKIPLPFNTGAKQPLHELYGDIAELVSQATSGSSKNLSPYNALNKGESTTHGAQPADHGLASVLRGILERYGATGDSTAARADLGAHNLTLALCDPGATQVVADCIALNGRLQSQQRKNVTQVLLRQLIKWQETRSSVRVRYNNPLTNDTPAVESEGYSLLHALGAHVQVRNVRRTLKQIADIERTAIRYLAGVPPEFIACLNHPRRQGMAVVFVLSNAAQNYSVMERQGAVAGLWASLDTNFYWPWQRRRLVDYLEGILKSDQNLRCRVVRLSKDETSLDYQLRRGLEWEDRMSGLSMDKRQLPEVFGALRSHLPMIIPFVKEFPIRLLPPEDFKNVLGMYRSSKFQFTYWTRYMPPKDEGRVIARFTALDDKTLPNSIGISYRLFERPELVVPVLYHEYLHYGGVNGDSHAGIANEAEVWLRETIFLRKMIADKAAAGCCGSQAYTDALAALSQAGLYETADLLARDVHSPGFCDSLNELILLLYGPQRTKEEATAMAEQGAALSDLEIARMNEMQTWDPEIMYPSLDASGQGKLMREIIYRSAIQRNVLAQKTFDNILREPAVRSQLESWNRLMG